MVDIIIKGMRNYQYGVESFEIAKIKAGVVLKDGGGMFLLLSSKELSKKFVKLFEGTKFSILK